MAKITESQREEIKKQLKESILRITFEKKDGTNRVMLATLLNEYIEPILKPNTKHRKPNPDVCCVFDIEKGEFRSFRWDSLISWEVAQ